MSIADNMIVSTASILNKIQGRPWLSSSTTYAMHDSETDHKDHLGYCLSLLKVARDTLTDAVTKIETQEKRIAKLESLLVTDELTGLMNRRGFSENFVRELDRSSRNMSKGGLLIIIDLDNFKAINDKYGHLAGDACLQEIGQFLKSHVRIMDTAARVGADEFVLLLCNTTRELAIERAQQIAWKLNQLSIEWEGKTIEIRGSVGLKDYGSGDKTDDVFEGADSLMYESKLKGKVAKVRD